MRRNSVVVMAKLFSTPIVLLACIATFGGWAQAQRGRPEIPDPPRSEPKIKDPPGGPREDVWSDENGLEIRTDSYTRSGQRNLTRITRRCPDGSVSEVEIFHFGVISGGTIGLIKWEKWVYGCYIGNDKVLRSEIWEDHTFTEDGEPVPARKTFIVPEHTEHGRVVPRTESVDEWDSNTGRWVPKTTKVGVAPVPSRSSAANGFIVANEVAGGLNTTTFSTPHGKIRVNLPSDMAAGDTLSGTVITEPEGKNEQERAQNQGKLTGYVIELEKQQTPASSSNFKRSIPTALASGTTNLILKDKRGKEFAKNEIAVVTISQPPVEDFQIPTIGQQGRIVEIRGPFDGDFASTAMRIGDEPISILAESPRRAVARNTSPKVGLTKIEVQEQGQTVESEFRSIGISLSAPKLNLLRGEQTTLTVVVTGLEGIRENLPLVLENKSPNIIGMGGGVAQNVTISPAQVRGGKYTTERPLTGVQRGDFSIIATVTAKKDVIVKGKKPGGVRRVPTGGPSVPKEGGPKQVTTFKERTQEILAEMNRQLDNATRRINQEEFDAASEAIKNADEPKMRIFESEPFRSTAVYGIPVQDWARFIHDLDKALDEARRHIIEEDKDAAKDALERAQRLRAELLRRLQGQGNVPVELLDILSGMMRTLDDAISLVNVEDYDPALARIRLVASAKRRIFTGRPFSSTNVQGISVSSWLSFVHFYNDLLDSADRNLRGINRRHARDADQAKRDIELARSRKQEIENALQR